MADFRVTIELLDVGAGDADDLAAAIHAILDGAEFKITVAQEVYGQFLTRSPGDDLIEA